MPKLVLPQEVGNSGAASSEEISVQVKTPRRVLHFSDGTLEEYSDDEVGEVDVKPQHEEPVVDPKTLAWGPWTSYMVWAAGSSALAGCDYVGEWLAEAFGITTPRYYFEIEECKKREAEKQRQADLARGWSTSGSDGTDGAELVTKDVTAAPVSTTIVAPAAAAATAGVGVVAL